MHCTSFLAAALLLAPGALAHGYLKSIIVGGVSYPGWEPFSDPYITPKPVRYTRSFKDNGPVPVWLSPLPPSRPSANSIKQDFTTADITCNTGGNVPLTNNIPVRAGSQVSVLPSPLSPYPTNPT